MTGTQPPPGGKYPQAIADDYPDWAIEHHDGRWTAWCPPSPSTPPAGGMLRPSGFMSLFALAAISRPAGNPPQRSSHPDSR